MPRSKEIPPALRYQAVGLAQAGKSYREIASILKINNSRVYYFIKKYKTTGSTIYRQKTGRLKLLTPRASRQINSMLKKNRTIGLRGITEIFNFGKQVLVSV